MVVKPGARGRDGEVGLEVDDGPVGADVPPPALGFGLDCLNGRVRPTCGRVEPDNSLGDREVVLEERDRRLPQPGLASTTSGADEASPAFGERPDVGTGPGADAANPTIQRGHDPVGTELGHFAVSGSERSARTALVVEDEVADLG